MNVKKHVKLETGKPSKNSSMTFNINNPFLTSCGESRGVYSLYQQNARGKKMR